jgi:hypothetical protein
MSQASHPLPAFPSRVALKPPPRAWAHAKLRPPRPSAVGILVLFLNGNLS